MTTADHLRNNIIDKLLTISNKEYLAALHQLVEQSSVATEVVTLTEEQVLLLQLSDKDIENGRLVNQELVDRSDWEWLKEL